MLKNSMCPILPLNKNNLRNYLEPKNYLKVQEWQNDSWSGNCLKNHIEFFDVCYYHSCVIIFKHIFIFFCDPCIFEMNIIASLCLKLDSRKIYCALILLLTINYLKETKNYLDTPSSHRINQAKTISTFVYIYLRRVYYQ